MKVRRPGMHLRRPINEHTCAEVDPLPVNYPEFIMAEVHKSVFMGHIDLQSYQVHEV